MTHRPLRESPRRGAARPAGTRRRRLTLGCAAMLAVLTPAVVQPAAAQQAQPRPPGRPAAQLQVQWLDSELAASAALVNPALAIQEESAAGEAVYDFMRVRADGGVEALPLPADARPSFGLNGELSGVVVTQGAGQTLRAWNADGTERWSAPLPAGQRAYVLPEAGFVTIGDGTVGCTESPARLRFFAASGAELGVFEAPDRVIWTIAAGPAGEVAFFMGERNALADNEFVLLSAEGAVLARRVLPGSRSRFGVAGLSVGAGGAAGVAFIRPEGASGSSPTLFVLRPTDAGSELVLSRDLGCQPAWVDDERVALLGSRSVRVWDATAGAWDGPRIDLPGFAVPRQARLLGRNLLVLSNDEGAVTLHGRLLDNGAAVLDQRVPQLKPDSGRDLFAAHADGVLLIAGARRMLVTEDGR